ncbi:MAG: hypothetical protein IJ428_03160 [Clostridia bacterium]|nr:hypothetical protein [Clostridia bacterium]
MNGLSREMMFSRLKGLKREYVEFLSDICRIESPTEYKEGMDAVGTWGGDYHSGKEWCYCDSLYESVKRFALVAWLI